MIKIPFMVLVFKAIFYEHNKNYSQVLLDECLYGI